MSELTIRQGIQDTLQALSNFADADVTLSDWAILTQTGAHDAAPFVIITPSEDFDSVTAPSRDTTTWNIPAWLFEAWDTDWPTTLEAFAATRQAVIDALNASLVAVAATRIARIRPLQAPTLDQRDDYTYLMQPLIIEVEEL